MTQGHWSFDLGAEAGAAIAADTLRAVHLVRRAGLAVGAGFLVRAHSAAAAGAADPASNPSVAWELAELVQRDLEASGENFDAERAYGFAAATHAHRELHAEPWRRAYTRAARAARDASASGADAEAVASGLLLLALPFNLGA